MDIAEIRKKAKAKAGTPPGTGTSAPAMPLPVPGDAGTAAAPRPADDPTPAIALPVPVAGTGLDRLFAGNDGMQFASEEAYQTALVAREAVHEEGVAQFLAFQLGSEEYALDITQISEIIKPREYTAIPRVPEFILGLISLRGVVVPVFDLRRRFRLGETVAGPAARIVVCREGDVIAGLLVDSINQVIRLAVDRIEPPPSVLSGIDRSLVDGVGRFQGRMIILLNLASVLDAQLT